MSLVSYGWQIRSFRKIELCFVRIIHKLHLLSYPLVGIWVILFYLCVVQATHFQCPRCRQPGSKLWIGHVVSIIISNGTFYNALQVQLMFPMNPRFVIIIQTLQGGWRNYYWRHTLIRILLHERTTNCFGKSAFYDDDEWWYDDDEWWISSA